LSKLGTLKADLFFYPLHPTPYTLKFYVEGAMKTELRNEVG